MGSIRRGLWLAVGCTLGAANAHGQSARQIRGQLAGIVPGWVGAIVSIPYLRIGTIAGDRGTFRLRTTAPVGCYELVVRGAGVRTTHYRFLLPSDGPLDLGSITLRAAPSPPDLVDTPPIPRDTIGHCRPAYASVPESWPTGYASIVGTILRGGHPLRGATVDLACGDRLGARAVSDSSGRLSFELHLEFPQEQQLANGGVAQCLLRHRLEDLDSTLALVVRFGHPEDQPTAVTTFIWDLPEPKLVPGRVVAPARSFPGAIRIPSVAMLHIGILTGPQMIIFELLPPPAKVTFQQPGVYYCPSGPMVVWGWDGCQYTPGKVLPADSLQLLPIALRVASGGKRPTTGSSIDLALPASLVTPDGRRSLTVAYGRIPLRFTTQEDAFIPISQYFDPALRVLRLEFLNDMFDDDRESSGGNEALIVLAVPRARN
jgi:hypothetical protein